MTLATVNMSEEFTFIPRPNWNEEAKRWDWDGIELVDDPTGVKGKMLIATKKLQRNLLIPFGGVKITKERHNYLWKNSKLLSKVLKIPLGDYLTACGSVTMDGHPEHLVVDMSTSETAWMGCRVNEPSKGEISNSVLTLAEGSNRPFRNWVNHMPLYPYHDRENVALVMLVDDVDIGQEITVCYDRGGKHKTYERGEDAALKNLEMRDEVDYLSTEDAQDSDFEADPPIFKSTRCLRSNDKKKVTKKRRRKQRRPTPKQYLAFLAMRKRLRGQGGSIK